MSYDNSEHSHQVTVVNYCRTMVNKQPLLSLIYAVPNGARTNSIAQASKLKAEGLRRGFPDLCLPVPIQPYHSLYIEMKKPAITKLSAKGALSIDQAIWLNRLYHQHHAVAVCYGAQSAIDVLDSYLSGTFEQVPLQDILGKRLFRAVSEGQVV